MKRRKAAQLALVIVVAVLTNLAAVAINALTSVQASWPGPLDAIRVHPFRWAVMLTVATTVAGATIWWWQAPSTVESGNEASPRASAASSPVGTLVRDLKTLAFGSAELSGKALPELQDCYRSPMGGSHHPTVEALGRAHRNAWTATEASQRAVHAASRIPQHGETPFDEAEPPRDRWATWLQGQVPDRAAQALPISTDNAGNLGGLGHAMRQFLDSTKDAWCVTRALTVAMQETLQRLNAAPLDGKKFAEVRASLAEALESQEACDKEIGYVVDYLTKWLVRIGINIDSNWFEY